MNRTTTALVVLTVLTSACTRQVSAPTAQTEAAQAEQTTTESTAATTIPTPIPMVSPPFSVTDDIRDDGLTFTFGNVNIWPKSGYDRAGNEVRPQGVFLIISLCVANTGASPVTFLAEQQRLRDSHGRFFSPNLAAEAEPSVVEINPGNRAGAYLDFDIPRDSTPSEYMLLLHSSPDSQGVTVRLPNHYRNACLT